MASPYNSPKWRKFKVKRRDRMRDQGYVVKVNHSVHKSNLSALGHLVWSAEQNKMVLVDA